MKNRNTPVNLSIHNNGHENYKSQSVDPRNYGGTPTMAQPSPHYHFLAHPHLNDGRITENGLVRHPQSGQLLNPAFLSISSNFGVITDLNQHVYIQDQHYARILLPRATLTSYRDGQAVTASGRGFVCFHHDARDP